MTHYTINGFWRNRLSKQSASAKSKLPGWQTNPQELPTFKEAPLTLSDNFGAETDPVHSPLLLVSAPGAVGKSTLARQIASLTGATYIDLAKAEPVGGNTLSGGLAKSDLYNDWQAGTAAVLIDGLDEARLKVTQEAFEAFLSDIAEVSAGREMPTVLFGRTGAVQDAWLLLSSKLPVSVFEIGYYRPEQAVDFAYSLLTSTLPDDPHLSTRHKALQLLLELLRKDTEGDGDRFAGYAPVLQAIADHVSQEKNPANLISKIENGVSTVTLNTVVKAILEREQRKLESIAIEDQELLDILYNPTEQLQRLAARVYNQPPPPLPAMSPNDRQTYSNALETWLPEHPFIDGNVDAASTVFEAAVAATALRNPATAEPALNKELSRGIAANPFLSEFYLASMREGILRPEHIGIVYASLRSRLSLGDSASLQIEGGGEDDEEEEENALASKVEITITRPDKDNPKFFEFTSEQVGSIKLGSHIEDVEINAPLSKVEISGRGESIILAPVNIQCDKIIFSTERIIVESNQDTCDGYIHIESNTADTENIVSVPIVNGNAKLSVTWSGSDAYPWTGFSTAPTVVGNKDIDEALRRFRKFIIAFRSHSKGSLKRLRAKIEHARMTKGTGRAVLNHLIDTGIVTVDGRMYTLHPEKLAAETDTSYGMCVSRHFSERAVEFVTEAISEVKVETQSVS